MQHDLGFVTCSGHLLNHNFLAADQEIYGMIKQGTGEQTLDYELWGKRK